MPAPKNDDWLADSLDWMEPAGMSVTLFVNGMVITGDAVPAAEYFRRVGGQFREVLEKSGNRNESFVESFSELADNSAKLHEEQLRLREELDERLGPWLSRTPEQDVIAERLERNFIQLKDVSVIMDSRINLRIPLWRGRLSEVSGWCFGRAEVEMPSDPNLVPVGGQK